MNLDNLVTQDNADEGVWVPAELYGRKMDFDLKILGDDSDIVQRHNREYLKKIRKSAGKRDEFDDEAIDEIMETGAESAVIRIAGIRGWKVERKGAKEISREPVPVTLNGEELKNDKASYRKLVEKIPALKQFVLKVAGDRANFLPQPGGN